MFEILDKHTHEFGIVYCSTRKAVEQVAEKLKGHGIKAAPYHAGLSQEERTQGQNVRSCFPDRILLPINI
ncbi:hypothetical protein FACS1894162_2250 [Bacteroidia bacterium]|nr:hypothetical protein FACS1894162_2250 [Bacteroidia bacterium]